MGKRLSMVKGERKVYREALDIWGESAQCVVLMEECGELVQALAKRLRRNGQADFMGDHELAEELADVTIMVRQVAMLVGEDAVATALHLKLTRLRERVRLTRDG